MVFVSRQPRESGSLIRPKNFLTFRTPGGRRRRTCRVFAASLLTALFLYGFLYYGNYRYRLPYEPLMVLVAATFLTRLWTWRTADRAEAAG